MGYASRTLDLLHSFYEGKLIGVQERPKSKVLVHLYSIQYHNHDHRSSLHFPQPEHKGDSVSSDAIDMDGSLLTEVVKPRKTTA